MRLAILVSLAFAAACAGSGTTTPCASPCSGEAAAPSDEAPLPPENAKGVVGGPKNETAFDFEPEPPDPDDSPPILDGVPDIPDELAAELAPYLASRRAQLAGVGPAGAPLYVRSRQDGVTQLFVVREPGGKLDALTTGRDPITQAAVSRGSRELVLRRDRGGDENYQVIRKDLATGELRALSEAGTRSGPFRIARDGKVAFTNNRRSPADMDLYVAPGDDASMLVRRDGQWLAGPWARDGRQLLLRHYRSIDESQFFIVDTKRESVEPLPVDADGAAFRNARFVPGEQSVGFTSDYGGDMLGLYELDLETHATRELTPDLSWDVERFAYSRDGSSLAFVTNEDGASRVHLLDRDTGEYRRARGIPRGVISSLYFTSPTSLTLTLATATRPSDAYVYDLETRELRAWTDSRLPQAEQFVEPKLIRYESFDGLEIPAYVYAPPGPGPHPTIVWVHGGPEGQHRPSLNPIIQYFVAEREIAVVAPNIRGSNGYGREFRSLDDGKRRPDAVADIGALLDWISSSEKLDGDRVGIHGASYGGYMVLAALVEYGDRIAAGSNMVGISHFVTFLENTGAYRRDQRRAEYGDERDPKMREFLHDISPLTQADQIRSPLLVAHGKNDPRVPVGEAEQIVEAVRAHGNASWYVLAPDEGHGFRKRKNRDVFFAVMALFFERELNSEPDY